MLREKLCRCIQNKYIKISSYLNERSRRIWAAIESESIGYGVQKIVRKATGLSINTIRQGIKDLTSGAKLPSDRVRRLG